MSAIPEISNPYIGSFAIGLVYGLGVCTAHSTIVAGYIAGIGQASARHRATNLLEEY
jgi:hypothetical protein